MPYPSINPFGSFVDVLPPANRRVLPQPIAGAPSELYPSHTLARSRVGIFPSCLRGTRVGREGLLLWGCHES
ncbi:hypothetical protein K523DRAFT_93086 [Schizophyllum commune Tattone D]|nr:hypothetical protein K523DRAFT_93086 [Schizophyllum commune Tattone D]